MSVEKLNEYWEKVSEWTKAHRSLTQLGIGTSILLYGYQFPGTILVVSSLRVTGFPEISGHIDLLVSTFKRTVAAVKEAAPEIASQIQELKELRSDFVKLEDDFKLGTVKPDEYKHRSELIQADIQRLQSVVGRMNSSFQVIKAAVDPVALQELLRKVYSSILGCIAVASSNTAKICSIGFSIGHVIGDRLKVVVEAQRGRIDQAIAAAEKALADNAEKTSDPIAKEAQLELLKISAQRDWISSIAGIVGNSAGFFIAYFLEKASLTFSACSLGSEMIISSLEDLVDPYLEQAKLPTLKSNTELVTCLQASLVTIGFTRVVTAGHPHGLVRILLSPLYAVEKFIDTVFLSSLKK